VPVHHQGEDPAVEAGAEGRGDREGSIRGGARGGGD